MTTAEQTMDPAPGSHTPSAAPHVEDEGAIDVEVVEREVVEPDSRDDRNTQDLSRYEERPLASAVPDIAQAATDASLMSRGQYRALADRLILDKAAWFEFFDRCKCFASVGMYGHRNPATVAAAALKGMSLGMSMMEAIDRIKVIHGTPVIRGPAAINHIHERCRGAKCRCIESTREKAVWRFERPGWEPKEFTYTWEEAEEAGLTTKRDSAYKKYPARCLKWQAASEGAQEMFGDVLGGLYFQEELDASSADGSGDAPDEAVSYTDPGTGPTTSSTGDGGGDGSSSTGTSVDPTEEHPKVSRVKELLHELASKRGATDDTLDAVRKAAYNEALSVCEITVPKGKQPTLPQLDKMIGYLEKVCSA